MYVLVAGKCINMQIYTKHMWSNSMNVILGLSHSLNGKVGTFKDS